MRGIQACTRLISHGGMFLLFPMMFLTVVDVIGRVVWARPVPGAVELSSYMLSVFILLGLAYTHQVKGHVRVSLFASRLPPGAGILLEIVITLLSFCIISLLAWQGWVMGMEEKTVSDMLRIPQWPFRLLVSVAGLCLCLELLVDLTVSLERWLRR